MVTDISNASRTNLMDLRSHQWHLPTLDIFGIKREMLAEIKSNAEVYGHLKDGPLQGVPIAGDSSTRPRWVHSNAYILSQGQL